MTCIKCGKRAYSELCTYHKPRKPIAQRSKKELTYQRWLDTVARPYLLNKYGSVCQCCYVSFNHKLDIDHIINKGSHPELKKELSNLQFLDRVCHYYKTIGQPCSH